MLPGRGAAAQPSQTSGEPVVTQVMNPREIEIFVTIMRCRTLSAAAEQLHVTQPALSKALRHCEDRLGYRLFHRIGGRLNPTAEAQALIATADEVYRKMRAFAGFAAEIGGHAGGILRIGASSSVASSIVPRAIAALRREMPGVHVVLQMLAVPELEEALAAQRVDLGVALSPILAPVQHSAVVAHIPCVVLVQRGHPLARRDAVALADLTGLAEIGFGPGQDFGRSISAAFASAGLKRSIEIEVGTTTAALALVRAAGGYAIVDAFTRDYLPDDMVALALEPVIARPLTVAHSPGSGTPALAHRFRAILTELTAAMIAKP